MATDTPTSGLGVVDAALWILLLCGAVAKSASDLEVNRTLPVLLGLSHHRPVLDAAWGTIIVVAVLLIVRMGAAKTTEGEK